MKFLPIGEPIKKINNIPEKIVSILENTNQIIRSKDRRIRSFSFVYLNKEQRRITEGDSLIIYNTHLLNLGDIGTNFLIPKVILRSCPYSKKQKLLKNFSLILSRFCL